MTHTTSGVRAPLGVAIIGSGSIARLTHQVIDSLPGAEVVTTIPGRELTDTALRHAAIDVVAITTANGRHVADATLALSAGKHVVVEKPLTLDVSAGRTLLTTAALHRRTVAVISQRRWEPIVTGIREAVASKALGKPVLAECLLRWQRDTAYYKASPWRGTWDLDGGVLYNQAIHLLDLMRWLLGPVATVTAFDATRVRDIEAPDTAVASLRFTSGALGVVSATVASAAPSPAELNLHFEHGTVRMADDQLVTWDVPDINPPEGASAVGSGAQDPAAIGLLGHQRQWKHIIDAILDSRQPEVRGADALGTAALVAAIHASAAADGQPTTPAAP